MINNNVVIVIGIGRLGASIARDLSESGENVMCIDMNAEAFNKLDDFAGYTQVGDATDLDFLEKIGIKRAKAVIITTDSDDINVYLSHVCFLIFNLLHIYIRLGDSNKSKLLKDTPVTAIYPFLLSLDRFKEEFKEAVL